MSPVIEKPSPSEARSEAIPSKGMAEIVSSATVRLQPTQRATTNPATGSIKPIASSLTTAAAPNKMPVKTILRFVK